MTQAAAESLKRLRWQCTINKSKDYIFEQVVNMGFLPNVMLYQGDEWLPPGDVGRARRSPRPAAAAAVAAAAA